MILLGGLLDFNMAQEEIEEQLKEAADKLKKIKLIIVFRRTRTSLGSEENPHEDPLFTHSLL